jgi:uroporphyrin-3 C-methyltransferase
MTDSKNSTSPPDKPSDAAKVDTGKETGQPVDNGPGSKADQVAANSNAKTAAKTPPKTGKPGDKSSENSQQAKAKTAQPAKKTPQTTGGGKKGFPITAAVALALGLAVAGASYLNYTRWQMADLQSQSLANENTKLHSRLDELQQQISGLQRQDLDTNLGLEQFQTDMNMQSATLKQLGQQFQALAADKGKDPMLWRVAEVEYLLSVANQQLILERDVDTALTALQDADRRLEAIGDPALIPVRKSIAGEITALESVEVPDIVGMALRLSSLVDNIENLPLVNRERAKTELAMDDTQVEGFNELMAKIMKDLKGVVTIRRSDEPIEPLLPPEEQHYLSQNLGLKLEEARIALLRRDTDTFRQNLTDTGQWVQRYFDPESAAVNNVIAAVQDLQDVELKPELPDISGSLRDLRRWLASQQRQRNSAVKPVARPPAEPATPASPSPSSGEAEPNG